MNHDTLVIGDTHFEEGPYDGYLDDQLKCIKTIIKGMDPENIVFLGDIFHHRKPHPLVILKVFNFFKDLVDLNNYRISIIRGNHDAISKSDDDLTLLDILNRVDYGSYNEPQSWCNVFKSPINVDGVLFIPHYENDQLVIDYINKHNGSSLKLVFGHFGYDGCVADDYAFTIPLTFLKDLKVPVILGHIHSYKKDGNVTILGTPYSTCFGDMGDKYVLKLDDKLKQKEIPVLHGPKHVVLKVEELEDNKKLLNNTKYSIILRVLLNKFEETDTDLKSQILDKYKAVKHVEFKFQPIYDKKLNHSLSDYNPGEALTQIDDNIIDRYLDEQQSSIPTEDLRKGLEEIHQYGNKVDKDK